MPIEYPTKITHWLSEDAKKQPLNTHEKYPFPGINGLVKPEIQKGTKLTAHLATATTTEKNSKKIPQAMSSSPLHGITRLSVVVGEGKDAVLSQPFNNGKGNETKVGRYLQDVDPTSVFCFAPGVDKPKICWKVRNTDKFTQVKFELFCKSDTAPIWEMTWREKELKENKLYQNTLGAGTKSKDAKEIVIQWTGSLDWDETVKITNDDRFPDGILTVEHSPYQLRMTVNDGEPGNNSKGYPLVAWTYIHILVHSLELEWCDDPKKVLPISENDKRAQHLLAYQKLKDNNDTHNLSGRIPQASEDKKIYLKTNIFYQGESELIGNTNLFYRRLHSLWGDGIMIPILVNAKIKKASGDGVNAPNALGNAKYLWNWSDQADITKIPGSAGVDQKIRDFLDTTYNYETSATQVSPRGKNCHVDRGGKRGANALPIFPAQQGTSPGAALQDPGNAAANFPFKVTQCASRRWNAVSESWNTGELAGKSGVIFQPSIIAGDSYQLDVLMIVSQESDAVSAMGNVSQYPASLRVSSGIFTIWHEVDVVKYIQIGNGAQVLDMDRVRGDMAKCFIQLKYDQTRFINATNQWQTGMTKVYSGNLKTQLADYIQDALPTAASPTNTSLIEFKTYSQFKTAFVNRHGDEAGAYAAARQIHNPVNGAGEPKYDWHDRPQFGVQRYPFQEPWPINHANAVTTNIDGQVDVEFVDPKGASPNNPTGTYRYTIVFEPDKRIIRDKNVNLTVQDKLELARRYENCIRDSDGQFPPYQPNTPAITVNLYGKTSATNQPRLTNIRTALDQIVESFWHNESTTGNFFPAVVGGNLDGDGKNLQQYRNNAAYEWVWNIIQLVLFDLFPTTEGGIYMLQIAGTDICNFNGPKAKAMFANTNGNQIITVLSPTAQAPTLEHEIGHTKFLNHTFTSQHRNDPLELHQQDIAGNCTMKATGVGVADNFCGLCMLRMRGWSLYKVDQHASIVPSTGAKIESVTVPSHGTVVKKAGNTKITYTPSNGFTGVDHFTYTVKDSNNRTVSIKVTVKVAAGGLQSSTYDSATTPPDTAVTIDIIKSGAGQKHPALSGGVRTLWKDASSNQSPNASPPPNWVQAWANEAKSHPIV